MPRKPRIEYEGAVYHVLNRGNYQEDLFDVDGSGPMFEEVLFAAAGRFGWILHAYVIMSNHYHLAMETPEANLVVGMQWLQSTFGNRFNRVVRQRGHVFQGRYKALLVEDGGYLLKLVNYVHLNPVRAGIVEVDQLRQHALSSFPKFFSKKRPACLANRNWLALAGDLVPTPAGMRRYHKYLAMCHESDSGRQKELHVQLCRGWFVGTREGKEAILSDIADGNLDVGPGSDQFGKEGAELLLKRGLASLAKPARDLEDDRKGAVWKVVLASWVKSQCGVGNQWLSEHLFMGNMHNVSRMVSQELKAPQKHRKLWKQLKRAKN